MGFYDFTLIDRTGKEFSCADLAGKVVLIVNTATGCGFTPHYEPIEALYEELHDKGLEVLDIPCNQFGAQAPGTDDEIHEFCQLHYNTTFAQMKKSDVNGANELPLYTWLKAERGFEGFGEGETAAFMDKHLRNIDPDYESNPDIKWNFTKFVIDRDGTCVARFEPTADMADLSDFVRSLI